VIRQTLGRLTTYARKLIKLVNKVCNRRGDFRHEGDEV